MDGQWFTEAGDVDLGAMSGLAQWLIDHDRIDEVPRMIEKPWDYDEEWLACTAPATGIDI